MNYNYFSYGIISEEILKKISYLSFSKEAREINALLTNYTRNLKKYLKLAFIFDTFSTIYLFFLLALVILLRSFQEPFVVGITILFILMQFFVLYLRKKELYFLDGYQKVTRDLGDNLLNVIFSDYSLSLKNQLPKFSYSKKIMSQLSLSAKALREYLYFVKETIGIVIGFSILIFASVYTRETLFTQLTYEIAVILVLFVVYTIIDSFHQVYQRSYEKKVQKHDQAFLNSEALLTRTHLGFDLDEYEESVKPLRNISNNRNLIELISKIFLPMVLLFLPVLLVNFTNAVVLLIAGLFITIKLFNLKNPIYNKSLVKIGQKRIREIEQILQNILEKGSEITPNIYKKLRHDYLAKRENEHVDNQLIWGDLQIKNLAYETGWNQNSEEIYINSLTLPHGKISLLVGEDGIGKTLFGRLITLRYGNFTAERLSLGNKDLRTFKSLDYPLKYLHFSSLRHIATTYRRAIAFYIRQGDDSNLLVKRILSTKKPSVINVEEIYSHYRENANYYGDVNSHLDNLLTVERKLQIDEDRDSYLTLISTIFENLENTAEFNLFITELAEQFGEEIVEKSLYFAFLAEYISFKHLEKYVSEATINFMDADLSKPPISQEMRMRFLLALDVFMKGLIFVVDDPFSNLDKENAEKVFKDLVNYAQNYQAIVLILDKKIYPDILEEYKGRNVLGKVLRFEGEGASTVIRDNDLEIS